MQNQLGTFHITSPNTIINQSTSDPNARVRIALFGMDRVINSFEITLTTRDNATNNFNPVEVFSCDEYSNDFIFASKYKDCTVITIESNYVGSGDAFGVVTEGLISQGDITNNPDIVFSGSATISEKTDTIQRVRTTFDERQLLVRHVGGNTSDVLNVKITGHKLGGQRITERMVLSSGESLLCDNDYYIVTEVTYSLSSSSVGGGSLEIYTNENMDDFLGVTNDYSTNLANISNNGSQTINLPYNPTDVVIVSFVNRDDAGQGRFTVDKTTDQGSGVIGVENMYDGYNISIESGITNFQEFFVNDYRGSVGEIRIGKLQQTAHIQNNPPEIVSQIPNVTYLNTVNTLFDLDSYFMDPDNDILTYTAVEHGQGTLPPFMSIMGNFFNVTLGGVVGDYDIDVTANDGNGGTVTQSFRVTIQDGNNPTSQNIGKWIRQITTNNYALIMQETESSYNCVEWLEIQNPINIDYFKFARHFIYQSGLSVNVSKALVEDNVDYEIVDLNNI